MKIEPVSIDSGNIQLLPISHEYFDDFYEYSMYSELYDYLEFDLFQNKSEASAYLDKLIGRSKSPYSQYWFIKLLDEEKVIGSFGLLNYNKIDRSIEIGYGLSPKYWGKGIFSKVLDMFINHIFNTLCLCSINAVTQSDNLRSIIALRNKKFEIYKTIDGYYVHSDGKKYQATFLRLGSDAAQRT